jgi:hypothetical protein
MHRLLPRLPRIARAAVILACVAALPAHAAVLHYRSVLSGLSETPQNTSVATGNVEVTLDAGANTLRVVAQFANLQGTSTASHIHGPTAQPGLGNADVATTVPSFAGFPLGVNTGTYDNVLDLTQASSYNPSFIAANGGTPAGAENALISMLANGTAYFNIHSTFAPGGEIRGFLLPFDPTPTRTSTWSRVRKLFR